MKTLGPLDYLVVALFFAVMIGVGAYYGRRQKDARAFFGGDKAMPWWLAGVSFYMCTFSALAFVMYSALAYKFGFLPVTVSWLLVPCIWLGAVLTAVRWRRVAVTSPLEFIEARFGNGMRQGLVWLGLPMRVLDDAFKLLAIGTVTGVGFGFPLDTAIAVSGTIVLAYTFMGGLKAALVCDFIQFFVLFAAVLMLPFFCLDRVGGFGNFLAKAPEGFFNWTADKYNVWYLLALFFICFLNRATNWALVQRYYSTKSDRDALKVGYLVAVLLFVGPPLFFFPAMAARVFMPGLDMTDADVMNGVYACICREVLPTGCVGLVVAAMFSATMSTLAGDFNAAASVLTHDFYRRMVAPRAGDRHLMIVARLATVAVGALVVGLTFLMRYAQGSDDLFNTSNKMFGVFVPPIAIPTLAGLLVRRLGKRAGVTGLLAGIVTGVACFAAGARFPSLREMPLMTSITTVATLLGLWLGTRFRRDTPSERAAVADFFARIEA